MRSFGLMTLCCAYALHATLPATHLLLHRVYLPQLQLSSFLSLPLPSVTSLQRPRRRPSPSRPMERRRAAALFGVIGRQREGARRAVGCSLKTWSQSHFLAKRGLTCKKKSAVKNLQQFRSTREEKRRGEKGMNEENNQD